MTQISSVSLGTCASWRLFSKHRMPIGELPGELPPTLYPVVIFLSALFWLYKQPFMLLFNFHFFTLWEKNPVSLPAANQFFAVKGRCHVQVKTSRQTVHLPSRPFSCTISLRNLILSAAFNILFSEFCLTKGYFLPLCWKLPLLVEEKYFRTWRCWELKWAAPPVGWWDRPRARSHSRKRF